MAPKEANVALKTELELFGDLVLIRPFKPTEQHELTPGGLYAPTSEHEKRVRQVVLGVGPDVKNTALTKGAEVCVGKHAGVAVDVGGLELKIVQENEVLGLYFTVGGEAS